MKGYQPQGRLLGLFVSRVFKLAMLGMFMAFWIVACSGGMTHDPTSVQEQFDAGASSSSAQCQVIQHDVGETEVCGQPEKLVALGPNMLEILLVLDVQPVGYADYFPLSYREFDQPDQQIPYLGERVTSQPSNVGTSGDPSLEAIVKLKPDLILGNSESNQDEYALLSQIAPTLLFHYGTNGEWQQHIQTVAKVLDRSEQAESVIADHTQKVAQMRESLQPIANAYPRMLLLGSDQLEQNLQIDPYNHKSYCSSLVEDLGFELVLPSDIGKASINRR